MMRLVSWIDHLFETRPKIGFADEQNVVVAVGVNAEVLPVVEIEALDARINVAREHDPAGVDDHDLKGEVRQELAVLGPEREIEMLRVSRVAVAHVEQGLIGRADRANDLLLEGPRQVGSVLEGRLLGARPILGKSVEEAGPNERNRGDAEQRAAIAPKLACKPVEPLEARALFCETSVGHVVSSRETLGRNVRLVVKGLR